MTRVCYVIPSLSVGGTERQLVALLRGLVKDHELRVVCTRRGGALAGDVHRLGVDVRVLGARSGWDFTMENALYRFLRAHPADVVHSSLFGFDLFVNRAARKAGVPVVISSRRQLATWKRWRHLFIQKRANRLVDCIVANSRAVAEFAAEQERADPALFRVIYNGMNADEFVSTAELHQLRKRYRIPFHRRVIGLVANFAPVKDHPLFVATARALVTRRADVHFLTVGTGPDAHKIDRMVAHRDLSDCFTRLSTLAELPDLYRLMDVSVLCSKVEGFPNAVIESMAAGVPVVAAAVGGIPEIIQHEKTGRLVNTRAPEDFAREIAWVLDHPDESDAMARRAAQFVRSELTLDRMADNYRALYDELLAEARQKGR